MVAVKSSPIFRSLSGKHVFVQAPAYQERRWGDHLLRQLGPQGGLEGNRIEDQRRRGEEHGLDFGRFGHFPSAAK